MAAWDSGTDPSVFSDILFINTAETEDGIDNDGNGFIDDMHGIAYDIDARPTTGLLYPLGDAAERMPQVMAYMKGFMDLQASVDSPDASALKQHLASLDPSQIEGFLEDLGLAGNYSHGTHVAGLMTAGNPYARLLIARLSYDHRTVPIARTVEWGERDATKCRDTVEYFKQQGVRVVNMSWGESQDDAESSLEANGIGKDAEERREIARQVFTLQKQGLYEAIKSAPQILFICAAGNADNDVEFDEYIPSSFDLPNLLTVGAVDQAGDPTSFTSFGKTVQVYANGFEVDSFVPGGERMAMSGTSMASPNVANLAGKLVAIDPDLTPVEIIELIKRGADERSAGSVKFLLMNPGKSVELARE
jgi:subtilisin family serine protease